MAPALRALLLASLCMSAALAGCTDDGDSNGDDEDRGTGPSPTQDPTGGSRLVVAGARPLWFEGLQWTYEVDNRRAGIQGDITLVVVREEDTVWQLAPTNESDEEVVKWTLFSHLPPVGSYTKDTFAPDVHGKRIQWFDWPLQVNKTWTAPDARDRTVTYTASATTATLFDEREVAAFEVVGTRDGIEWLRYVYTAEAGFFVTAELDGDGDGTIDVTIRMTDARAGAAHLDTPTFEPTEVALLADEGATTIAEPATAYTISDEAELLYAFFVLGGGPGRYTGSVTLPSGAVKSFNFTNTNQTPMSVVRGASYPVAPGQGDVGSIILGDGYVRAELFEIVRRGR